MTIAYKLLFHPLTVRHIACLQILLTTVEPRYNEVAGDRPIVLVKSRVRYIETLNITNLRGNDQNVRCIQVIVND